METVLVTGGAGFIGYYTTELLVEKGNRVVCYDAVLPAEEVKWLYDRLRGDVEFVKGDVSQLTAVMDVVIRYGVTKIAHIAALTDTKVLAEVPMQALRVNTEGSMNMLEIARLLKLKRVVMLSSVAVYAPKQYEPIDEFHPVLLPNAGPALSSYSSSKLAAEAFALHYWNEYDTSCIALRPTGVYGFGMRYPLFIKPMIENAIAGQSTAFESGGDAKRDFVYVRDVAQGVSLALDVEEERLKQRIFNLAHGGPLRNVFYLADEVRKFFPDADISIQAEMSPVDAQIDRSRGVYFIQNTVEQLGYRPEYDLENGIGEYIELQTAYMKHLNGNNGK